MIHRACFHRICWQRICSNKVNQTFEILFRQPFKKILNRIGYCLLLLRVLNIRMNPIQLCIGGKSSVHVIYEYITVVCLIIERIKYMLTVCVIDHRTRYASLIC